MKEEGEKDEKKNTLKNLGVACSTNVIRCAYTAHVLFKVAIWWKITCVACRACECVCMHGVFIPYLPISSAVGTQRVYTASKLSVNERAPCVPTYVFPLWCAYNDFILFLSLLLSNERAPSHRLLIANFTFHSFVRNKSLLLLLLLLLFPLLKIHLWQRWSTKQKMLYAFTVVVAGACRCLVLLLFEGIEFRGQTLKITKTKQFSCLWPDGHLSIYWLDRTDQFLFVSNKKIIHQRISVLDSFDRIQFVSVHNFWIEIVANVVSDNSKLPFFTSTEFGCRRGRSCCRCWIGWQSKTCKITKWLWACVCVSVPSACVVIWLKIRSGIYSFALLLSVQFFAQQRRMFFEHFFIHSFYLLRICDAY